LEETLVYGPEKIAAEKCVESITEVIKEHLFKTDAFNNTSLAYYGMELSYKLEIKLHSRGENTVKAIKDGVQLGVKTDDNPKAMRIKGECVAGRRLTVKPGEHTREREGVEVS
jgi:hypothetical protein